MFTIPAGTGSFGIYFIDTAQSDATLLNSLGLTYLEYIGVSPYHADPLGGLDGIWSRHYRDCGVDRGINNLPTTQSYNNYANRYSSVRQMVTPGQVSNLGGGNGTTNVDPPWPLSSATSMSARRIATVRSFHRTALGSIL